MELVFATRLNFSILLIVILSFSVEATITDSPLLVSPYLKDAEPYVCSLNDGNEVFCSASLTIKNKKVYLATTGHCLEGISEKKFVKSNFNIKCGSKNVEFDYHFIDINHLDSIVSKNDNMILLPIQNEFQFNDIAIPELLDTNLLKSLDTSKCVISGCSYSSKPDSQDKKIALMKDQIISNCKMVELKDIKHRNSIDSKDDNILIVQKEIAYEKSGSIFTLKKKSHHNQWAVTTPGDSGGGFICEVNDKKYLAGVHNSHSGSPYDLMIIKTVGKCESKKNKFELRETEFSKEILYIFSNTNSPDMEIDISSCNDVGKIYSEFELNREARVTTSISLFDDKKNIRTLFMDTKDQDRLMTALVNCQEIILHPSGTSYDERCYCNFSQNTSKSKEIEFSCKSNDKVKSNPNFKSKQKPNRVAPK